MPTTRFLRLRLIALGIGLGLLLRVVWGEYRAAGDDRHFQVPVNKVQTQTMNSVEQPGNSVE